MQKDKQERYLELLAGLRLMDDDFFSEALDEKIAPVEYILNTVLERDDIRVLRTEAQVEYKSAANRSIKLDIRAVDAEGRVMDIEVQRADRGAGVRRARFHSSMLDRTLLDKGKDFEDLVDTYVIFITEHDRFGAGLPLYHVERRIAELDEQMERDNARMEELLAMMADPDFYVNEDASSDAIAEHAKLKQRLAAAEEEWFTLTEELEAEMARQQEQA